MSAGLFGIVWGLVRGNALGWSSPADRRLARSPARVLTAAFVAWELRAPQPMLPMRFFRDRTFALANAASLLMCFGMFGSIFLLAQFFQTAQGYSPLQSGLRILPWTAMPMIVAPIAGALSDRIGGHKLMGAGPRAAGGSASRGSRRSRRADVSYVDLVLPFAISGIGMGLFFAPVANVVLSAVRPQEEGQASGANNAIRELGGVLGVAVLASVFAHYGSYESPATFSDGMVPAVWIGAAVVALRLDRRVRDQAQPPRGSVEPTSRSSSPRSRLAAVRTCPPGRPPGRTPTLGGGAVPPPSRPRLPADSRVCMPFGRSWPPRSARHPARRDNGRVAGRARVLRLLVLGAGPEQLGLLEAARAHGIWTAVCDRDPAAPGFRLASPPLHRLDRGRADDRAARGGASSSTA